MIDEGAALCKGEHVPVTSSCEPLCLSTSVFSSCLSSWPEPPSLSLESNLSLYQAPSLVRDLHHIPPSPVLLHFATSSIFYSSLLVYLIGGWTPRSSPLSNVPWSWRASSHSFSLPLPISSTSTPILLFHSSVHYSLSFPLEPVRAKALLNSEADSTASPGVTERWHGCVCLHSCVC